MARQSTYTFYIPQDRRHETIQPTHHSWDGLLETKLSNIAAKPPSLITYSYHKSLSLSPPQTLDFYNSNNQIVSKIDFHFQRVKRASEFHLQLVLYYKIIDITHAFEYILLVVSGSNR